MEYTTSLKAIMVEGHGPVTGLLYGIFSGNIDETKEGFLKFQLQLLKLGGAGSDEEGPNEVWQRE